MTADPQLQNGAPRHTPAHRTHIRAGQPWWRIDWREVWEYRDLLRMLVLRDLTAIYKQTILGPLWFIVQPLVTTLVFTVIFGKVANVSTDGIPHLVFYMCGSVMWNFFSGCMTQSGNSLVSSKHVLSKVYFPRLVIPLSAVFVNLAHFALNLIMFIGFYLYYVFFAKSGMVPQWSLLAFPLLIVQCAVLGFGVGLWVAALTTKYQDLRFGLTFITQIWMYATPIVWPASLVTRPAMKALLWMNPMSFVVECSRWMFTGTGTVAADAAIFSLGVTVALCLSGLFMFNRIQRTFVDTI